MDINKAKLLSELVEGMKRFDYLLRVMNSNQLSEYEFRNPYSDKKIRLEPSEWGLIRQAFLQERDSLKEQIEKL